MLIPIERDVLRMLHVELRQARAGETRIVEERGPVDRDYVEMLEETIAEIERLREEYEPC